MTRRLQEENAEAAANDDDDDGDDENMPFNCSSVSLPQLRTRLVQLLILFKEQFSEAVATQS